jgi:hypothetical protein
VGEARYRGVSPPARAAAVLGKHSSSSSTVRRVGR